MTDETDQTDNRDLLRLARARFDRAMDAERENREQELDDLKFRAGEQWEDAAAHERREANRPCLTINRMGQYVRQVTGDIRLNKPAIKVRPVDDRADPAVAEILTGLIRHIEAASDAQAAYSTAAEASATCGEGHFRIVTDYADDDAFDQDIRIRRITNPFSVFWDPAATELTKEDAGWCFVMDEMGVEEFKAAYPDANTSGWDSAELTDDLRSWMTGETVRVAEYWLKEPVTRTLWLLPDGSVVAPEEMSDEARATVAPLVQRERKAQSHRVVQYILTGDQVLSGPHEWPGRHIPIVTVLGEEIHVANRTVRHGIVRWAKDPQRLLNYLRSASLEMIGLAPKAPWLVTKDQIKGHEARWQVANYENLPYLLYNVDQKSPAPVPQRVDPPPIQGALLQEAALASDDMKAVTGIYDAALGARSNETSGRAIMARQREGDVGTFVYVDNLSRAIGYAGRILVDLIPRIFDTQRMVRILGEDGAEELMQVNVTLPDGSVLNDLTRGKYDVVVQTGPSYSTKRQEAADSILQFVQAVPQAGGVIGDLLAKNMDWPGAEKIAERLKKLLPPGLDEEGAPPPPPPPPNPKLMAEAELRAAQADGQKLDNAGKQLALAAQTGQLEAVVAQLVRQQLMQILGPPDPSAQPGPMQPAPDPGGGLLNAPMPSPPSGGMPTGGPSPGFNPSPTGMQQP